MRSTDHVIATSLETVREALASVPTTAYSVPHVYPSAAPAYESAPYAEREHPVSDQLRLYVHVPFCSYHCSFCYFAVRAGASEAQKVRYVRGLLRELEWVPPGTPLSQLYVGGGTPTSLPPELLDELLEAIGARMPRYGRDVHTVETSPETLTDEHLRVLARRDVGRVSMGIQTLAQAVLDGVHRKHTVDQTLRACALLAASGLIANIDLIYGLPGQTEESFRDDLRTVTETGIHAVTLYSLRVNERTPVTKTLGGEPFDLEGLMRWRAHVKRSAEELGYTRTRWHTFKLLHTAARRHERAPCFDERMIGFQLGIGMSARSHLGYTIYRNHDAFEEYLRRIDAAESPVEQIFALGESDRKTQLIARTIGDGKVLFRNDYARAFGNSFDDDHGATLERLKSAGLIDDDGERLALTDLGELVYDLVTLAFYPPHAQEWLRARERHAFVRVAAPAPVAVVPPA